MFERSILQDIKSRVSEERKFIQVLVGPRQVGKTTLIKHLIQKIDINNYLKRYSDDDPSG